MLEGDDDMLGMAGSAEVAPSPESNDAPLFDGPGDLEDESLDLSLDDVMFAESSDQERAD